MIYHLFFYILYSTSYSKGSHNHIIIIAINGVCPLLSSLQRNTKQASILCMTPILLHFCRRETDLLHSETTPASVTPSPNPSTHTSPETPTQSLHSSPQTHSPSCPIHSSRPKTPQPTVPAPAPQTTTHCTVRMPAPCRLGGQRVPVVLFQGSRRRGGLRP